MDQLIAVFDVGKSVSKTHLEFGQEAGRFWVAEPVLDQRVDGAAAG